MRSAAILLIRNTVSFFQRGDNGDDIFFGEAVYGECYLVAHVFILPNNDQASIVRRESEGAAGVVLAGLGRGSAILLM